MRLLIALPLVAGAMAASLPMNEKRQGLLGSAAGAISSLFPGDQPVVKLDYADYRGISNPLYGTQDFLGMRFATARRLEESQFIPPSQKPATVQDASKYGNACPQVQVAGNPINFGTAGVAEALTAAQQILAPPGLIQGQSEDCLFVNVQVPKGVKKGDKLPVMMWIHGGGYELGAANAIGSELTATPNLIYQGGALVKRSVEMNKPVVFVSANHRLNFFGTLAGKEIAAAGAENLYLKDQRLFMKWVKTYIAEFGGDPDHVVAFGESAGAMSLGCHFAINPRETEDFIKGAWMFSGGPMKLSPPSRVQRVYDDFVNELGCKGQADTLACLKRAPYDAIYRKVQRTPNFLGYTSTEVPWYPRPDGKLLKESPHLSWKSGNIANIPMVIGDMKDEGTLFSQVNQLNVTNTEDWKKLFKDIWWPDTATDEDMNQLARLYPDDPTIGSPFDTGALNSLTPQYKRIAALTGDATFESQRRFANEVASKTHNQWSYQIELDLPVLASLPGGIGQTLKNLHVTNIPQLGSFHIGDVVLHAFGTIPPTLSKNSLHIMSCLVAFVHDLDPNGHGLPDLPSWPKYKWGQPAIGQEQLMHFTEPKVDLIPDGFRREAMQYLNDHAESFLF